MVNDISFFKLTKDNAKEYYFLNECRMSWMDRNGFDNASLFRSYNFDKELLDSWANEWLQFKIDELKTNFDFTILRYDFIDDFSDRINKKNFLQLVAIYNNHKNEIPKEKRMNILYYNYYSEVLSKLFEYGLLYSANKLKLNKIKEELFNEFIQLNEELKKYDSKYIKKLMKRIDMQ